MVSLVTIMTGYGTGKSSYKSTHKLLLCIQKINTWKEHTLYIQREKMLVGKKTVNRFYKTRNGILSNNVKKEYNGKWHLTRTQFYNNN